MAASLIPEGLSVSAIIPATLKSALSKLIEQVSCLAPLFIEGILPHCLITNTPNGYFKRAICVPICATTAPLETCIIDNIRISVIDFGSLTIAI